MITPESAAEVYHQSIVINGLDTSRWTPAYLRKMQASGLTAANCTVQANTSAKQALDLLSDWYALLTECADCAMPVHGVADIQRAKAAGKVGIILGFQYAEPLEDNPQLISVYHRLGLRIFQLTYMHGNRLGDGCLEPRDAGLTAFGREVVQELNRHHMLIDLSHVGHRSTMEAIEASAAPVALTHVNSRNLCDHPRNKRDEAIRFCAQRGGVIGAVALGAFVHPTEPASMERYLDHIDYLVRLVGLEHVGIGTDFTEGRPAWHFETRTGKQKWSGVAPEWPWPYAVAGVSEFPQIALGLARRGYDAHAIEAILGGNWLRLLQTVWG